MWKQWSTFAGYNESIIRWMHSRKGNGILESIIEPARETAIIANPDVLVVGGGPAGIGAAIAAARNGAKVMLVERYGFVGGNMTIAMVNPMFTFHDVNGVQVIRGIAGELVTRLVRKTMSPGHVKDLTFDNASMTPFDPEGMKLVLLEMLEEAGVSLLLHSVFSETVTDEAGHVTAVIVENKSGRQAICPKIVIDCSADADVAAKAGAPFVLGRESDGAMQPVTLFFRIAGVEIGRLKQWMKANKQLLKDCPTDEEIDANDALAFLGMKTIIEKAVQAGEYPRDAAPRILMYQLPKEGQFAVNCTRLQGINGTDVRDLTRAEIATRKQAWDITGFLQKHVGGFEQAYLLDTGAQVGIRETRHIIGDYTMVEQDVLSSRSFDDGIACGTFAIDIHPPEGEQQIFTGSGKCVYEIPYRSLLPQGVHNMLVAGRAISATHHAFGSVRVMATAMGIGQGAGTAAAIAVKEGTTPREVDASIIREALLAQGQYLLGVSSEPVMEEGLKLDSSGRSGTQGSHYNPF
jgi:hypothetical protein